MMLIKVIRLRFVQPILLCLLLVALSACGKAVSGQSGITLEFWTLQLLNFKSTLQPMIDRYEATHPGITIHWVDVPFSEGEKRALTAMLSPNVPDVVNLNPDFSAVLASRNALLDLNQWTTPDARATYLPVAWQASSLQGKAFGFPWYITSKVTLYNQKLLHQAGWQHPPRTYAELARFARDVKSKTGAYALMPNITEHGNFLKSLQQLGVTIFNEDGRATFAENPASLAHLQFWKDLYTQGLIPPETLTEGHRAAVDRYQAGTLAMLVIGPNFLNIIEQNAPQVFNSTRVAEQFPQNTAVVDFSTMVLVVPRQSRHPKEAVDFARYITNATNQQVFAQAAPVLPSTQATSAPEEPNSGETDTFSLGRAISARQLASTKQTYRLHPRQQDLNALSDYYVQRALTEALPVEEALTQLQAKINARVLHNTGTSTESIKNSL